MIVHWAQTLGRDKLRQIFRVFSFIAITAISFSVVAASAPQTAHAVDELGWYGTDRQLVDGETITGNKRITLVTDARWYGRYVTKWCIYIDGQAIAWPSYARGWESATLPAYIYYVDGVGSREAAETSSGCWATTLADRPYGFDVTLNTTAWSNGSHTIKIEAMISDSSIISKTTTVVSNNTDPTVEWTTTGPLTPASTMTLTAKITPRVNRITKACLTRDGTAISRSEGTSFSGDTKYNDRSNGPTGTFGKATGGCETFDFFQNSRSPSGLWQPTNLTISLKTSTWAAIPATLKLTITESIGREFSASIAFNQGATPIASSSPSSSNAITSSGEPLSDFVSWKFTGVSEGQMISGWSSIESLNSYSFAASGSIGVCITGIGAEKSCDSNYIVNTACFKNGPQVITATASGKYGNMSLTSDWEEWRKYNVSIMNSPPSLDSVKAINTKPSWKNSTTSGSIALNSRFGCSYSVKLKSSSSSKVKTLTGLLAADSTSVAFSGLKQKTKYTAVVSVLSENGTGTKTFKFTTPAIPAKPRSTYSGGSSGGSRGGSYLPNVRGWQLDRAMSMSSSFYYKQYSSCGSLRGFENGFWGVADYSNWVVVDQSGSLLYVCKRK